MRRDVGADELRDTFRGAFVGGRWLLAAAESAESVRLLLGDDLAIFAAKTPNSYALGALALLFAYNVASLILVHRVPPRRLPAAGLLALDLLFIAFVAAQTGGGHSPFLRPGYLILLAAALLYGLPGGVLVGAATAVMATREAAPYFLLMGTFTGYLVERLRAGFRSYQESAARERERELAAEAAGREMALARAIQQAALPKDPPRVPGMEIAARCAWAHEVGGDFYLFLPAGERLGLALGDVSGKGFPAALVATSVAHLLPWLEPLKDAGAALRALNRDLIERLPGSAYVTLVYAEADAAAGTLRLWSAGHPPALLWRAAERQVREASVRSLFLAFGEPWDGEPEHWPFDEGDVLLLYSDGLTETRGGGGAYFGSERAAGVLAQNAGRSPGEIADALARAAREWGPIADDLTLLVCKRVAP